MSGKKVMQVCAVGTVGSRAGERGGPLVLRTLHPEGPEGQALDSLQALAPQGRVADISTYIFV